MMRSVAFLLVGLASAAAGAQPKLDPVLVVPVDVDFCDFCKLTTQDKLVGIGTVEVYDTIAPQADKAFAGDKPLMEVTVVLQSGSKKHGIHLDLGDAAHHTWAVRETHRVVGFHEGIVTDRRLTPNNAVALRFDIDRKREGGATAKETLLVACSHPGAWTCTMVRVDDSCKATRWDPPVLGYTCEGQLTLTPRTKAQED